VNKGDGVNKYMAKANGWIVIIVVLLATLYPAMTTMAQETKQAGKPSPATGPDDSASKIYLGSDGKLAGRGVPEQPASEVFRLGKGVHPKALSLPGLPKDKFGLIDWASMVKQGIIQPAGSLQPGKPEAALLDLNILIKSKGDFVHNVMFRHSSHVYWLDCKNCHPAIFVMTKGKNNMSMQGIVQGKWCGRCHGKVSFPLTDCKRCHSQSKQ